MLFSVCGQYGSPEKLAKVARSVVGGAISSRREEDGRSRLIAPPRQGRLG